MEPTGKSGCSCLGEEGCCFLSHSVHYVVEPCPVQDREKGTESLLEESLLRCLSSTSCLLSPLFLLLLFFVSTRPGGAWWIRQARGVLGPPFLGQLLISRHIFMC